MNRVLPFLLIACGGGSAADTETGEPLLGSGLHDISAKMEKLGGKSDGLNKPTDLAFNPERPGELWVVNKDDDSTSIFFDVGTASQTSEHRIDPYALHFMEQVTSISFGAPGTFGTCQDGTNTYNEQFEGNNFTGPTLWSSDLDVFAYSNPDAVDYLTDLFGFYTDLGSHLDMLHESPECMGIAWEKRNVYWVFDGYNGNIVRYDFQEDHGIGYDDHSDGIISRWVDAKVKRKKNVVSHLAFEKETGLLYIADTGNNRIQVLDTKSGREGDSLPSFEPGTDHHEWVNGDVFTLITGEDFGMQAPAGLALGDGKLWVTDNATGNIHAFDLTGAQLDYASTGLPEKSLAGIRYHEGALWLVDQKDDALYRVNP